MGRKPNSLGGLGQTRLLAEGLTGTRPPRVFSWARILTNKSHIPKWYSLHWLFHWQRTSGRCAFGIYILPGPHCATFSPHWFLSSGYITHKQGLTIGGKQWHMISLQKNNAATQISHFALFRICSLAFKLTNRMLKQKHKKISAGMCPQGAKMVYKLSVLQYHHPLEATPPPPIFQIRTKAERLISFPRIAGSYGVMTWDKTENMEHS